MQSARSTLCGMMWGARMGAQMETQLAPCAACPPVWLHHPEPASHSGVIRIPRGLKPALGTPSS